MTPVTLYIDPSVVTYLIQAVAGVVIAVGAAVGIYFRKAKKKVNVKLGIDEIQQFLAFYLRESHFSSHPVIVNLGRDGFGECFVETIECGS